MHKIEQRINRERKLQKNAILARRIASKVRSQKGQLRRSIATGDTMLEEMLARNSVPEPNSGCWIWMRGVAGGKRNAYPVWKWEGRRRQASHLALQTKGINIPKGFDACHACDNTYCVNPDHLFVGTRKDNMHDAQTKKRLVGYGVREFCKQGHPLSGDNLYIDPGWGKRHCRICMRRWGREHDARRRPRKQ